MTAAAFYPRILCVGGEAHATRLPFLLGLKRAGLTVMAAGPGEAGPFVRAGIEYRTLAPMPAFGLASGRAMVARLEEIIGALKPAIVQSFDPMPNLLAPLAAARVTGIQAVRAAAASGAAARMPAPLATRPLLRLWEKRSARAAHATIFQNSHAMRAYETSGLDGPGESVLIPGGGIDVAGFDHAHGNGASSARLRESLGLKGCEVIIAVTRLTRDRGIPTLLKVAERVHALRPKVRFVLVGPREGADAISGAELARHAAYVIAPGPRHDVPALLRMADVFVLPSEVGEGAPLTLLEAALAGLPIAATDQPGRDDVIRDGWNGYLAPPGAARPMADRILALLEDRGKASEMGRRASAHVRAQYNMPLTVARYHQVYRALLDPGSATLSRVSMAAPLFASTPGEMAERPWG